jgi:large subunit ribosomal protein L16
MILYEMEGISRDVAHEAFRLASHKLPLSTKILSKGDVL